MHADPRKEYWIHDALDAFGSADPVVGALTEAWMEARPDSAWARAARAFHGFDSAFLARGSAYSSETSEVRKEAMRARLEAAVRDLDAAIARKPGVWALHALKMQTEAVGGSAEGKKAALQRALAACPTCIEVRVSYLYWSRPRWGGSYEEMDAFARESAAAGAKLPLKRRKSFGWLAAMADADRCDLLRKTSATLALELCDKAVAKGPLSTVLMTRAAVLAAKSDVDGVRRDATRVLARQPFSGSAMDRLAWCELMEKKAIPAGRLALRAFQLDPSDEHVRSRAKEAADLLHRAGADAARPPPGVLTPPEPAKQAESDAYFDLAFQLTPYDSKLRYARTYWRRGNDPEAAIARTRAQIAGGDDSFETHQLLDDMLFLQRRLDDIAAMWTAYLARHPDDARALRERSGTYHHMGKREESLSDLRKACGLRLASACETLGLPDPKRPRPE